MQSLPRGYLRAPLAVPAQLCARIRDNALAPLSMWDRAKTSRLAQLLGLHHAKEIRAPQHRRHIAMELDRDVSTALSCALAALGGEEAMARAGLSREAALVELSVMLVQPGAEAQHAHSDVHPTTESALCTLWCALQETDASMGPLHVYPVGAAALTTRCDWAAVEEAAQRTASMQALGQTYSADGEAEPPLAGALVQAVSSEPNVEDLALGEPVVMVMQAGDAVLMDCRCFHFGGSNTSPRRRAQLSATFQEPPGAGSTTAAGSNGFTYALQPALQGKHTLGDFLDAGRALEASSAPSGGAARAVAGCGDSSSVQEVPASMASCEMCTQVRGGVLAAEELQRDLRQAAAARAPAPDVLLQGAGPTAVAQAAEHWHEAGRACRSRLVRDGLATEEECQRLVGLIQSGLAHEVPPERLFSPHRSAEFVEQLFGGAALSLLHVLTERVTAAVREHHAAPHAQAYIRTCSSYVHIHMPARPDMPLYMCPGCRLAAELDHRRLAQQGGGLPLQQHVRHPRRHSKLHRV